MSLAIDWTEQIKFLIGIIAILNPLGAIPIYLNLMAGRRHDEMLRTALKASVAVAIILVLAVWAGDGLLVFFGIGIPAFRIGGGLLLMTIAIAMFDARISPARHTDEEQVEAEAKTDIAVVPLAVPLLAGPGAISLTIVNAHQAARLTDKLVLCAVILVVAGVVWIVLRLAESIGKRLGTGGLNIATRVMGLLLAAVAVQFIADGMVELFPGLTR